MNDVVDNGIMVKIKGSLKKLVKKEIHSYGCLIGILNLKLTWPILLENRRKNSWLPDSSYMTKYPT